MNGNANEFGASLLDFDEEFPVPMALIRDFIGIGDGKTAEQYGVALGIDEIVAANGNEGQFGGIGTLEGFARTAIMPPFMNLGISYGRGVLRSRREGGESQSRLATIARRITFIVDLQ